MAKRATGNKDETTGDPQTEEQPAAGATTETARDENQKGQEELRQDIEGTREELGDTVDALSQKADVKAQVTGAVDEQKQKLRAKQDEIKEKVSSMGGGAGGDAGERAKDVMGRLAERTSSQPLPYLGGALAVGLVVGMALRGRSS